MVVVTAKARVETRSAKLSLVNSPEATRVDLESRLGTPYPTERWRIGGAAPGTFSIARVRQVEPLGPLPLAIQYTRPRLNLPVGRSESGHWPSHPTGEPSSPAGTTARCACGTPLAVTIKHRLSSASIRLTKSASSPSRAMAIFWHPAVITIR